MRLRAAWRKTKFQKMIKTCWSECQQYTPRFNYLRVAMVKNYYSATSGGDHCDLNLSPVQNLDSAPKLEVLKRKTAFKGDSEAHKSLFKIIQQELEDDVITQVPDSFVKCWNPLFAISKKKGSCRKIHYCRILNSEFKTEYNKLEGITIIQEIIIPNDSATVIDLHYAFFHIIVAEEMRQCLYISFNGHSYNYKEMPGQKAMQLVNLRQRGRYSDPNLGSHSSATRNITSNEDSTKVLLDNRNGKEQDQPYSDSRILVLALEHKNHDNVNDNISKEESIEATKISVGIRQKKEKRKNKGLDISNLRDTIHKSTIQTRRASHKEVLKAEGQRNSQLMLEQADITQQSRDTGHNTVEQHVSRQQTILFHQTSQVYNDPDRRFELNMGATLINKKLEMVYAHAEWKDNNIKSSFRREVTAVLKELLEFSPELIQQQPNGIHLLSDSTVAMYCLKQYSQRVEVSHISGLSNTIPVSLSRLSKYGDYAIKREILQKTFKELGIKISEDVFATSANGQCKRYCNISKDKFVIKRDEFSQDYLKNSLNSLFNLSTTENYQEGQAGTTSSCSPDSTRLAQSEVVHRAERDCIIEDMLRLVYASLINGSEAKKQRLSAVTRTYLPFFQWEQRWREVFQITVTSQRTEFQFG
ncbi:MAG: hypothetical protein EZS28_016821 [Streblomastix strix]|uniref:Uncharacterized protein n=1 Tax=Streblomastix strix TaxID=222440 RepID=A0A5J4VZ24_9EUKA|nr:MAG: hypothetical protein EZS28_016821 [Streblomastix strix]